MHQTPLDGIPSALAPFAGRLLAGVGGALRLYDLGRARLLRKCEARLPTFIVCVATQGWRILVGDAHEGANLFQYLPEDNQLLLFADETCPRAISALAFLDYETIVGADRFGSLFVARLPPGLTETVESDGTLAVRRAGAVEVGGAPHKLERQAEYYLGDTVIALHRGALVPGARETIHYITISGAIGVLLPFSKRTDALFLQTLELFLRQRRLLGERDHFLHRSLHHPAKAVIDGKLCEEIFVGLTTEEQLDATQVLEAASPTDVLRRLAALRSSVGF